MVETIRGRLTLWYTGILALTVGTIAGGSYLLLSRALHARLDRSLTTTLELAETILKAEQAEGEEPSAAARGVVEESVPPQQAVAIVGPAGAVLAYRLLPGLSLPATWPEPTPAGTVALQTGWPGAADARLRIAMRRIVVPEHGAYLVTIGESLRSTQDDLALLRRALLVTLPLALGLSALGGWLLAGRSLRPVASMCERARRIGADNLHDRLPVANPRDELGTLALTFNELLARLAVAFERQRQFMTDTSHELRTPLSILQTAAAVTLERPRREESEYRQALGVITDQGRRMTRLVEDMFLLARADTGDYPLRRRPLDLADVFGEATQATSVLGRPRGVTVSADLPAVSPFQGDEDLLRRLAGNLLDNAVVHTPKGGRVVLTLTRDTGGYVLTVLDTGTGIPLEHQPRVFERFYRVDEARGRTTGGPAAGGAGLGLAISRWIVEAHGGRLELGRSDASGTVFTATLPYPGDAKAAGSSAA